jgi:hypothetical protein
MNSKTHEGNTPKVTEPQSETAGAEVGQNSEPDREGKAAVAAIWGRLTRGSVLCQK